MHVLGQTILGIAILVLADENTRQSYLGRAYKLGKEFAES